MTERIIDVTSISSFQGKKTVLLFWAPWNEASAPGGPMHQVLGALATTTITTTTSSDDDDDDDNAILFGCVQAEECTAIAQHFNVTVVPTFVLLNAAGVVVNRIEGGDNVPAVTQAVQQLMQAPATTGTSTSSTSMGQVETTAAAAAVAQKQQGETLSQKLDRLIASSPVMLFMKGTPAAPRCGFSRQTVELLQDENIAFGSFDILQDETVRQGLKTHSNWPTYPQVYVKSELIGGLDILKEMKESGESLKSQFGLTENDDAAASAAAAPTLNDRLGQLIRKAPVMLFMKGLPSAPRCGFSRQMVELLEAEQIPFDSFDILQDEEVRQGLKTYSNWPTYPQLYVKGELIGGLDIVKEMKEDTSLKEALGVE